MSEQSLTNIEHQVPQFTEEQTPDLESQDWGRIHPQPPEETTQTTEVSRETSSETTVDEDAQLASQRGWVPESEWKGRKERWVDAKTYNDRYEQVLPVVLKENKKVSAELKQALTELETLKREAAEWRQARQEQEKTQRQIRIDTLNMERKRAIENGDTDTLMRVDDELMDLKVSSRMPPAKQVTADQVDPASAMALNSFLSENPVFRDPKLGAVLAEQATLMRASGSTLKYREFLDEAKERVERMYPERFRIPPRRHAMAETGGAPSGGRPVGTRSWNDLRPEAKEALEKFVQTTPGMTREEILKNAGPEYFRS